MAQRRKQRTQNDDPFVPQSGPWADRVTPSTRGPYAFRPRQLLISGVQDIDQTLRPVEALTGQAAKLYEVAEGDWLLETDEDFDVEFVVAELQHRGVRAEPNHVFFSHSGGCGCGCCGGATYGLGANPFASNPFASNPFASNPFASNPFASNPFASNPFASNPFASNPFASNPFASNPFASNPFASNGERPSSARPAEKPEVSPPKLPAKKARAIILDTGIAAKAQLPQMLHTGAHPETPAIDLEAPDESGDGFLDPVSGHGTFIAGLIEQLAPGQNVRVAGVMTTMGDGDAASISNRLDTLRSEGAINDKTILNMSFGSYGDEKMYMLERAIRLCQALGAVVVASAGNDGTCLRSYPAAMPEVVGVGSIEPQGKAFYSNWGCWVRACAPGTDLISAFYRSFDGNMEPATSSDDPDEFREWAQWTGTSFAAPVVAAALMRHIALTGSTAKEAVAAVIDSPSLLRFPGMGTVVNLAPGM